MILLQVALNNISLSCHAAEGKVKGRKAELNSSCQTHLASLSPSGSAQALCKMGHLAQTCAGTCSGQKNTAHMWTHHYLGMTSALKDFFGVKATSLFQNPHLSSMQQSICWFWEELHHIHTAWPRRELVLPGWVCSFWRALIHDTMT